jgi:hypothetical protein
MKNFALAFGLSIAFVQVAFADCIPVAGLQFERISGYELLASRNGKNVAVLRTSSFITPKINSFRFFSEDLCTEGAEARFHIDGNLNYLTSITYFKK